MALHPHYDWLLATRLRNHPSVHGCRWSDEADKHLRHILFRSLVGANGEEDDPQKHKAQSKEQNTQKLPEDAHVDIYSPAEKLHTRAKHALMTKPAFFAPDASPSPIMMVTRSMADAAPVNKSSGKTAQAPGLPDEVVQLVEMTIGRVLDYLCDVLSCSPEQLRLPKTVSSVLADENRSRLNPDRYYGPEELQEPCEYTLMLWNDEKHTVDQVTEQVARACKEKRSFGKQKALEIDALGRSAVHYATDLPKILEMATILEQIKVSVTIRSSRDTFREHMCHTMIDWLSDISGCSVGSDGSILKYTICTELLGRWNVGSQKINEEVGKSGIHDHEAEDRKHERNQYNRYIARLRAAGVLIGGITTAPTQTDDDDDNEEGDEDEDMDDDQEAADDDDVDADAEPDADALATVNELLRTNGIFQGALQPIDDREDDEEDGDTLVIVPPNNEADVEMEDDAEDAANEILEATLAGYPPPPPPPAARQAGISRSRQASVADSQSVTMMTPHESDEGDSSNPMTETKLPKTPKHHKRSRKPKPPNYWLERPRESLDQGDRPIAENLWERLRIDHLILYDLRLWRTLRVLLRHLYISTMITVPEFKRVLGLRFAGLYTMLSQLYLIADREPDHSIIHLSVQLMTTPSIAAEVIDRANFLTNLLAILYTFLTTRQVGYPKDVSTRTTLALDAGTVTNRRLFHFYADIKYMFQSPFVREKIRTEPQYLMQFLDLVKLHQGICPNIRAVGDHVEYETDAWASATQLMREIVKFCRFVAQGFVLPSNNQNDLPMIMAAIRSVGATTTTASLGLEWQRFTTNELKSEIGFTKVEGSLSSGSAITLPKVRVLHESMSFHHPLHYLLSWLLQAGKSMSAFQARQLLLFDVADIRVPEYPVTTTVENGPFASFVGAEDRLSALFDMPLRAMAWQAQIRADMWIRNGLSLRHQMQAYRNTQARDHSFQRDIFMLQAGLVICDFGTEPPAEHFLTQMIDRFDMTNWVQGKFENPEGFETSQHIDVVEDFFNLLVVLLSEREDLLPDSKVDKPTTRAIQRDIAHVLCFKPLSYSDLTTRLTDHITDSDKFDDVLKSMTKFRAPGGLSDSGTFELLPDYIELIDPYYVFYTKNMREDSENIIKSVLAKKTGKDPADIVPEPHLVPITSGLFQSLSSFTTTDLCARTITSTLKIIQMFTVPKMSIPVPKGRLEALLPVVLHLILIAIADDSSQQETAGIPSLVENLFKGPDKSILKRLQEILQEDKFSACHARIKLIISRARERRPELYATHNLGTSDSITPTQPAQAEDRETKKRQALERQARVMAQFKEQQSSFLTNQGIDWGVEDASDEEDANMHVGDETETVRPYPADPCMLCQEETNDERLYGCFAFVGKSRILRQTPLEDGDFLDEVLNTPKNLDRSAESIRPFGVASKNRVEMEKTTANGGTIMQEHYILSKGFPFGANSEGVASEATSGTTVPGANPRVREGPVTTSCGHIMHWSCFEQYLTSTTRRHSQQIARNHPESLARKEFLCPLCKALGNMFIPLIWKPKKETYPGALATEQSFERWVKSDYMMADQMLNQVVYTDVLSLVTSRPQAETYVSSTFNAKLAPSVIAVGDTLPQTPTTNTISPARTGPLQSLAALLSAGREITSPTPAEGAARALPSTAEELDRAYIRIQETFVANNIKTSRDQAWQKLSTNHETALADTLGYSISAAEIASRGVAGYPSCLSSISDLSLTNLRIISETVSSYITLRRLGRKALEPELVHNEKVEDIETRHWAALLGRHIPESGELYQALFRQDTFLYLTHCSVFQPRTWEKTGHHVLRACFLAEMVKVSIVWDIPDESVPQAERGGPADAVRIVSKLWSEAVPSIGRASNKPTSGMTVLTPALRTYALAFLRKALILFHVRCGVDFAVVEHELDPDMDEIDRLTTLLRLPSFDEMLSSFGSATPTGEASRALASRWMHHAAINHDSKKAFALSHPAIFELVGLPRTFDALTEEARKRRCPTTGKEVSDPAICLFCGAIFCSQASCCRSKAGEGGCRQHMRVCGGGVGLFINVRKCMVLFLHGHHGSWLVAPYLDKHGEADPTLRRHHQLFLEQKRYDRLFRDVWLQHGIQSAVSRRLESDVNTGGWETL
ncbi:hypothetical protein MBLNU457_7464t1 [Dothideomycetes sp. NU457]